MPLMRLSWTCSVSGHTSQPAWYGSSVSSKLIRAMPEVWLSKMSLSKISTLSIAISRMPMPGGTRVRSGDEPKFGPLLE